MSEILFDESTHRFYEIVHGGERDVPSVSAILKWGGYQDGMQFVKPYYLDRGRKIHRAIHFEILGTLDKSTVDPVVLPYLNSWRRWRDAEKPNIEATEKIVHSEALDYAGIADAIIDGCVYDWKSGKKTRAHILQLSAYDLAINGNSEIGHLVYGVYLNADGSAGKQYEFKLIDQLKAYATWINLVNSFHDAQYDEDFKRHMEAAINGV